MWRFWFALAIACIVICAVYAHDSTYLSKAQFVRQNKCQRDGSTPDSEMFYDGKVRHINGWKVYACPSGVRVVIDNNEEQP
jgi:hypothetical protein